MIDSSSDSHSEKNLPHPSAQPSTRGLPMNDPGDILQGYRGQSCKEMPSCARKGFHAIFQYFAL